MRKRSLATLSTIAALALACALPASAAPGPADAPKAAAASPSSGEPGPQHRQLGRLAGHWNVRQSLWTDPARPPAVDQGHAVFAMVLGGRHLRQELRIDSAGKPFEGLGYIGYDNASGKYDVLWMDVNFTGLVQAQGGYDAATQTYTFLGAVPDPAKSGATTPLRQVVHIQDADHFTSEYYERHGGREMLAVKLEYTRAK
ncbi:hypothetical protein ASG87_15835 [Frateuria sp. Soil773]|uniref:DUF1579 family protein n=1 Tax=Frateuria sp. Soil773 TaxID=1736407 RepID=UPI0006F7C484|nr:DUF1579 family protein [Frateuria sp. Soil773]KRE96791.1 hypothetical protein ASG87_15835 [Frateuria sp. Soil773]